MLYIGAEGFKGDSWSVQIEILNFTDFYRLIHEALVDAYLHGDLFKINTEVDFGFILELFSTFRLSPHNFGNFELASELFTEL